MLARHGLSGYMIKQSHQGASHGCPLPDVSHMARTVPSASLMTLAQSWQAVSASGHSSAGDVKPI